MANHVVRKKKLGLPKESKESFALLASAGIINQELAHKLRGMVGFRNVLVHQYQDMDVKILIDVIENRLDDLLVFTNRLMEIGRRST